MAASELVLYYQPEKDREGGNTSRAAKIKGVLICMGVLRIRNVTPEQTGQTVGFLAGCPGFDETEQKEPYPIIGEEMMVMRNFTDRRIDEMLAALRRVGVGKISCKAVVTDTNSSWTLFGLYQELKREREAFAQQTEGAETGEAEIEGIGMGKAETGEAETGEARTGETRTGEAGIKEAETGEVEMGKGETADGQ